MRPDESQYVADWMHIAEKDLQRVTKLLADNDPELAGFCLQQAIEKFLKAFLIGKGWRLRRIHNLDALIDDAGAFDNSFAQFRSIGIRITSFYFLERYPSFDVKITKKDVQDALLQAMPLIEKVRKG